jgi:hypothetical protein
MELVAFWLMVMVLSELVLLEALLFHQLDNGALTPTALSIQLVITPSVVAWFGE